MNKKQATKKWINEFNEIPIKLIERAYFNDFEYGDGIEHLTYDENEEYGLEYKELPMWGTAWTTGCVLDEEWIKNNIDVMKKCGFDVYESEELGVFFGINGAGYDFYDSHWIPLYEYRGLKWHDEE